MISGKLFEEHDDKFTASVMYDTWGHLDAKPNQSYECKFYVAVSDRQILIFKEECSLSGPAYYYDVNEYAIRKLLKKNKPEGVYYFEGTYQMYKKSSPETEMYGYFKGSLKKVKL